MKTINKQFVIGIISGILLTIFSVFLLNPSLRVSSESSSYVDTNMIVPNYEFSPENMSYIEYLDIKYKVIPPFLSLGFNSEQSIEFPFGYSVIQKTPSYWTECIVFTQDPRKNGEIILYTTKSQFEYPECSATLRFVKEYKKEEIVDVNFNASWRSDSEGGRFYEEEGIGLFNKLNEKINNYIFIYNQNKTSLIKKRLSECKEIKVFIEQNEYPFRTNFFNNSSIVAVKMNFDSNERKFLILRCYHN